VVPAAAGSSPVAHPSSSGRCGVPAPRTCGVALLATDARVDTQIDCDAVQWFNFDPGWDPLDHAM
jgi:hypothetical protein